MTTTNKTSALLQQDKKLFHTKDLALLWKINHPPTLRTTISRYIKNGTLIPIQRGFYSTVPLEKLDPLDLGSSAIHQFCYLSTESVLFQAGIINQPSPAITFCSSQSKNFSLIGHHFRSRQLRPLHLYNPIGILSQNHYKIASPERAAADLLYYNSSYYLDAPELLNQELFAEIKQKVYA